METEHLCNFIGTYDKRDRLFNDHLENEKNPESREKGIPSYEGERTAGRDECERLRGKIRKRGNLDRVLIANMTMLNSPPVRAPVPALRLN